MLIRYYFELGLFLLAAVSFTFFISRFNDAWHHAHKDIYLLEKMRKELKEYTGKDEKLIESMKEKIEEEKEITSVDLEKAFEGLNETMFIAFYTLTFPL
jgi:hemerythrin-like domain-containing protein